jgi:predicted MPP superfamily phosphohydrolase
MMTRRKFLQIAAVTAASTAGATAVAHAGPAQVRTTFHRLAWPIATPLRVAHITDLHVGWGTPKRLLDQSVAKCRQAKPDLVVLTGDYLNRSLTHLDQLVGLFKLLPRPCVATLGNHDHWSGAAAIAKAMGGCGVTLLQNAHMHVRVGRARLPIVGVDDGFTKRDDVSRAFRGLSHPETALVLSHFPKTADKIAAAGGRLVLAGHTHGGQIRVPIVTKAIARLSNNPYLAGWYRIGASSAPSARLYVNAGIGASAIRLRVGQKAHPELAVIDLLPRGRHK